MKGKISVIIPVYNVETYIRQCLDSVVNQTYRNLEILLIDDGSPDNCGKICDEYAGNDDRIQVLHKQNGGVHAAWNDGLNMATGDWVAFVDSDDWIDIDYFEMLLNDHYSQETDVIQSGGYYWEDGRIQFIKWAFLEPFLYKKKEEKNNLKIAAIIRPNNSKTKGAIGFVWGKLFRAHLLKSEGFGFDVQIRTGLMGDALFNWDVFGKAREITGIVYCGYHYRITETSGSYKFDPNTPKEQEYVEEQFYKRIQKEGAPQRIQQALESRCLRNIVHDLQRYYFHPQNQHDVANAIRKMKQMPYCKMAILSKGNPYNNRKLKAFQLALRFPWIWPLKAAIRIWDIVDKR